MRMRLLLTIVIVTLSCFSFAAAQDDDNPSIAILRFGPLPNLEITEGAILDMLESYGFISTMENRLLEERRDHEGENLTVYWGDAGFDYPTVNIMVEDALDKEVDVIVAVGGTIARMAFLLTSEMDTPTPVLFSSTPFQGNFSAELNCLKPAAYSRGDRVALVRLCLVGAAKAISGHSANWRDLQHLEPLGRRWRGGDTKPRLMRAALRSNWRASCHSGCVPGCKQPVGCRRRRDFANAGLAGRDRLAHHHGSCQRDWLAALLPQLRRHLLRRHHRRGFVAHVH